MTRSAWWLLALLVACAAALAACKGDEEPPGEPTETSVPGSPSPFRPPGTPAAGPPQGAIEINGATFPLGLGTYCWTSAAGGKCVDAVGVITAFPYAEATPGDTIMLAGALASAGITVSTAEISPAPAQPIANGPDWEAWQPSTDGVALTVGPAGIALPSDLAPGRYLLAIGVEEGVAPRNTASYGAIVEVIESAR